jgi:quinol monooxygenase YgiN
MVVEYIRYRIDEERRDEFVVAYRKAVEALDDSPYCLGYEMAQCEEEPDRFVLRIRWTSTDDHLQKFRPSEQFRRFFPPIRPFVDAIEEMQHYQVIEDLTTGPIAETSRSAQ